MKDSAKLIVRQNEDSNGFETWRRLYKKFSLPGATRITSLLTQLLDFKFNPATFEQDFNVWETIKSRYERQSGQALPDGVLVATLLNKTTGALQQHLRLNARTLQTYAQVREVILEYHRSRLLMNPVAQTSVNATFHGGASAPMDIGALAAALWKGKGKGKGKKGKGNGGMKGKGKGKDFSKPSGKGSQHWNFMKGKGKGKRQPTSSSTSVCWSCGKTGHFASNCPNYRVSAVEGEELYPSDDAGDWSHFGEDGECENFEPTAYMAPLETFSLNGRTDENQRLFSVGDLGLKNLNTTFKDVALEEHLIASTLEDSEPWILFDSGAATRCCPKDFASEWPLLPLTGKAPPLRSISGQPLTVFGRRLVKVDFEGQEWRHHPAVGALLTFGFRPTLQYFSHLVSQYALWNRRYLDYFMATPANGQVTLTFQTADERAMLQSAIVLLHPAYDDGYFVCNGLNTLLDRAESPWWRLFPPTCAKKTLRAGDARGCVGPDPTPTLALFATGVVGLWANFGCCCADPTLYFDVPWRRPRYKQLWHNDFGSCTSLGLPLFSDSSFTCNFCTVDMRFVADSRRGAKLFSTLRFLPNTPEAHFWMVYFSYVLYFL